MQTADKVVLEIFAIDDKKAPSLQLVEHFVNPAQEIGGDARLSMPSERNIKSKIEDRDGQVNPYLPPRYASTPIDKAEEQVMLCDATHPCFRQPESNGSRLVPFNSARGYQDGLALYLSARVFAGLHNCRVPHRNSHEEWISDQAQEHWRSISQGFKINHSCCKVKLPSPIPCPFFQDLKWLCMQDSWLARRKWDWNNHTAHMSHGWPPSSRWGAQKPPFYCID